MKNNYETFADIAKYHKHTAGKKKGKTLTTSNYKKLADTWFSRYIRLRGSKFGKNICISCGKAVDIKKIQCGHFVSRRHLSTRFLEENCYPQCYGCNVGQNGNYAAFAKKLQEEYGPEIIERLDRLSHTQNRKHATEYMEIIGEYMLKVEELIEELNLNPWWSVSKIEKNIYQIQIQNKT